MSSRAFMLGALTCLAVSACASTTDPTKPGPSAGEPAARTYAASNDPALAENDRMADMIETMNAFRSDQGAPAMPTADQVEAIAAAVASHPLGSQQNPVRSVGPTGQRAYLSRLRCADGRRPDFRRQGSFGAGVYGRIIDGYSVTCPGDEENSSLVFMDMYHPGHIENEPVPGFTITP